MIRGQNALTKMKGDPEKGMKVHENQQPRLDGKEELIQKCRFLLREYEPVSAGVTLVGALVFRLQGLSPRALPIRLKPDSGFARFVSGYGGGTATDFYRVPLGPRRMCLKILRCEVRCQEKGKTELALLALISSPRHKERMSFRRALMLLSSIFREARSQSSASFSGIRTVR
jgi:hypothetical protein